MVRFESQTIVYEDHDGSQWTILLDKKLGHGHFSQVFLGTANGIDVAVKVILKKTFLDFKKKKESRLDLSSEVEALSELQHDAIVSLYEYHKTEDQIHVMTEWMQGGDLLSALMDGIYFLEPQKRFLFRDACFGVAYMHHRGFVHRDLKPENLLLTTRDRHNAKVKIADLGLALRVPVAGDCLTLCGTPEYMAPEVWTNRDRPRAECISYDSQADMWSLGVILFVLLSGEPPWFDEVSLRKQICLGRVAFDSKSWDQISKESQNLTCRLLNVDPTSRFNATQACQHIWLRAYDKLNYSFHRLCSNTLKTVFLYTGEGTAVYRLRLVNSKMFSMWQPFAWKAALREIMYAGTMRYLQERRLENFEFSEDVLLSGSSVLQLTYGLTWPCADADIFCLHSNFENVSQMMLQAGYQHDQVKYEEYPTEAEDLEGEDELFQPLRVNNLGAVHSFRQVILVHNQGNTSYYVDVVVAKPQVQNVREMLNVFDIQACQAAWDGTRFTWYQPHMTFQWSSSMEFLCGALLKGFLEGWEQNGGRVDIFQTQLEFLKSPLWRQAAVAALECAGDAYTENTLISLKRQILTHSIPYYFNFFHRQLFRVVKYMRRGLLIPSLNKERFYALWMDIDFIKKNLIFQ